ncbi:MAG: A/G-specific adenine glycosylase [Candidatus Andersenbacteria bacterium]
MTNSRLNKLTSAQVNTFRRLIWSYYARNRRSFPWREKPTPYRVVISEIMLQQTQAPRVVVKFESFVKQFSSWRALDTAPQAAVVRAWQGLGYNRRALALKKIARIVITQYKGHLPDLSIEQLDALPGIGYATACAVSAFAFNRATAFIETNIRAVYLHIFFPGKKDVSDEQLMPYIQQTLEKKRARDWYYALMDYGVMLKQTQDNPSRRSRHHTKQSKFIGSRRQVRGQILKQLAQKPSSHAELLVALDFSPGLTQEILDELTREGFLTQRASKKGVHYALAR